MRKLEPKNLPLHVLTQFLRSTTIMASAVLERLPHRSTAINIRGDSYRLKEKRIAKASAIEMGTLPLT